jgi:twinkle protein|tara:strand:- start:1627 stop:3201 length:1575 start_codon:yes stop_codon:yes gene_type:complete
MCHHCGESGATTLEKPKENIVKFVPPVKKELEPVAQDYLIERGLSAATLSAGGVLSGHKFIRDEGREVLCVGFPYVEPATDKTYAVKWRSVDGKGFTQESAAATFYGIEKVKVGETIVIAEGEIDALSLREAGVRNAVSVPNGAPVKVSDGLVDPVEDRKFGYVWAANELIKAADKIIIAVDKDGPGKALAEELARRIGKPKCFSVEWPDDCKDANDTLLKYGKARVANVVDEAEPWPIAGLYDADHYADQVKILYKNGAGKGLSTGYTNVDGLFTVKTGMVHVVTGVPSMGKSEFVDQLLFNLSQRYDWRHAICSFENPPHMHIGKLLEKTLGKPFHEGPTQRMSEEEMERGLEWINDHFIFMEQSDGTSASIDDILERGSAAVQRMGVRSLVIDPYNYLDMNIGSKSETNLISEMLSKVRNWAAAHDCAVFFIAHPAKLYRQSDGNYPVPKGYDISSSASWFSKADIGITVHRNFESDLVEIHVWKVRFKHLGKQGMTELSYDIRTGTYAEAKDNWADEANF